MVASLYVVKVMIPQGQYSFIPQFLDSNTHLENSVKQKILKHCEEVHKNSEVSEKMKKADRLDGSNKSEARAVKLEEKSKYTCFVLNDNFKLFEKRLRCFHIVFLLLFVDAIIFCFR